MFVLLIPLVPAPPSNTKTLYNNPMPVTRQYGGGKMAGGVIRVSSKYHKAYGLCSCI